MACLDNFVAKLPDCVDTITVNAGLLPLTEYVYEVIDYNSDAYSFEVTTDESGSFVIDTALFPDAYFNRYKSLYILHVLSFEDPYCGLANMTLCGTVTDQVIMKFIKSNKTTAVIG